MSLDVIFIDMVFVLYFVALVVHMSHVGEKPSSINHSMCNYKQKCTLTSIDAHANLARGKVALVRFSGCFIKSKALILQLKTEITKIKTFQQTDDDL